MNDDIARLWCHWHGASQWLPSAMLKRDLNDHANDHAEELSLAPALDRQLSTIAQAVPIAETDDSVLDIVEGEALGASVIEELLALVDRGEADNSAQLAAERDRLAAEPLRRGSLRVSGSLVYPDEARRRPTSGGVPGAGQLEPHRRLAQADRRGSTAA